MSGKPITEQQVRIYMSTKKEGYIQLTAAAKAGISERSGRRIEKGEIIPGIKAKRHWRTRKDRPQIVQPTLFDFLEENE